MTAARLVNASPDQMPATQVAVCSARGRNAPMICAISAAWVSARRLRDRAGTGACGACGRTPRLVQGAPLRRRGRRRIALEPRRGASSPRDVTLHRHRRPPQADMVWSARPPPTQASFSPRSHPARHAVALIQLRCIFCNRSQRKNSLMATGPAPYSRNILLLPAASLLRRPCSPCRSPPCSLVRLPRPPLTLTAPAARVQWRVATSWAWLLSATRPVVCSVPGSARPIALRWRR